MPFVKGNQQGHGRPQKPAIWKEAEKEIREALPRILRMERRTLEKFVKDENTTVAEAMAVDYIKRYPDEVIERFLPKAWIDDPVETKPLTPEEILLLQSMSLPHVNIPVSNPQQQQTTNGHATA